jgi:hypothetical protein
MSLQGERGYFFAPGAAPGFGFSALGFFASRLLLF